MSEADKMLFKVGYDEKKEKLNKIIYYANLPIWKPKVEFNKRNKTIKVDHDLHIEELLAINEKVKELRLE